MKSRDALERLVFHHDRMQATIERAHAATREGPVFAQAVIARERWTMARYLREYQVFKHTEIYGPAIRGNGAVSAVKAQRMAEQCIATGKEFEVYLRYWSSRDIIAEWQAYRPAMMAMTAKLQRAFSRDRAEIADLLAGTEHTRRLVA